MLTLKLFVRAAGAPVAAASCRSKAICEWRMPVRSAVSSSGWPERRSSRPSRW